MSSASAPELRTEPLEDIHAAIACVQRLSEAFQTRRDQLARDVGLTEHQWRVLDEISNESFMPSLFARSRESSRAAVSKTIRSLIDKGLVSVSVSRDDGRQRDYVLTPRGRRTMDRLAEGRAAAIDAIWRRFASERIRAFTEVGDEIAQQIEAYSASNRRR